MSELPLFYKVFKVIEMAGSVLKNNNKNGSCFLKVVSLNLVGHGCNAVTAGLFDGWSLGLLLSTISCWSQNKTCIYVLLLSILFIVYFDLFIANVFG